LVVDPDIEPADVITHNEDDVGFLGLCFGRRREGELRPNTKSEY